MSQTVNILEIGTPKIIILTVLKIKSLFFQCSNESKRCWWRSTFYVQSDLCLSDILPKQYIVVVLKIEYPNVLKYWDTQK